MEDDGFTLVRKRGKGKKTTTDQSVSHGSHEYSYSNPSTVDSTSTESAQRRRGKGKVNPKSQKAKLIVGRDEDEDGVKDEKLALMNDIESMKPNLVSENADFVDRCVLELKRADYLHSKGDRNEIDQESDAIKQHIVSFDAILCYGIGQFSISKRSKMQIALLLVLRERLECEKLCVIVCEPRLSSSEIDTLSALNCTYEASDNGLRRFDGQHPLLFMPHCPKKLYSNLLKANWSPDRLSQLVILGNSFSGYDDRCMSQKSQKQGKYVHLALKLKYANEIPLLPFESTKGKDLVELYEAFSDLSLHSFMVDAWKDVDIDDIEEEEDDDDDEMV